jgi:hypothetical protein
MAGNKRGKNPGITHLQTRYNMLAARLKSPGLILQGTITERTIVSSEDKAKSYGPYYQWTRKVLAKTVTVNLSSSQVRMFQAAINNNKRLERTVQDMRGLSQKICEATTIGVKKRKAGPIPD